jgi:hypothetical protein
MKIYEYLRDAGWVGPEQVSWDQNLNQWEELWHHLRRSNGVDEKTAFEIQIKEDIKAIGGLRRLRQLAKGEK